MTRDTKQIILDEALNLFSQNGYDGVSVADIAKAVGIKASSLYKHYKSKQDIFDSILAKSVEKYAETTSQLNIDGNAPEHDIEMYSKISTDSLVQIGVGLFLFFLHDEYARKIRQMLTIEQYKNPMASNLYVAQYLDGPLLYQSTIFKAFMAQGIMKNLHAHAAAMHFYSPIFAMLCLCDNRPDREAESLEFVKQHIIQFEKLYMHREDI